MQEQMNWWEVASSVLTFIGGGILAVDAFRARSNTKVRIGARELEEEIHKLLSQRAGAQSQVRTAIPGASAAPAVPTSIPDQLELSLAKRTRRLTIAGFVVVTAGFLIDLLVKLHVL
ncbi:MAG TPA: hypothetical protein VKW78_06800 [Terriglobales bacterium]|nr:hypothetical protein [Terriglobales bacterium]